MARPTMYDETLKTRLVDTAAEVIAADGPEALALRHIARVNETSTNAIYALFGSKAELVAAVCERALASFVAEQRAVPLTDHPLLDLRELAVAYRTWALQHPALYRVLFDTDYAGGFNSPDPHDPQSATGVLLYTVKRCQEQGHLFDLPAETIAGSMWASLHGLVVLEIKNRNLGLFATEQGDAQFEAHLASIARGWLRPAYE